MAKRKRLTPPQQAFLGGAPSAEAADGFETKSLSPLSAPPIARVAADSSASAALSEVTRALETARSEGRLILRLELDAIDESYLVRDRMEHDEEALQSLIKSLHARGQQTPIEVVALEGERYGLISGWRRLTALRRLVEQTGDERFTTVLALLRAPETAAEAYVAMVEENEVRAGLSYFERARIVDRAVQQRVYDSDRSALQSLFASASRPRRSKIGSFLPVVRQLESALRFPTRITERLGLRLAKALEEDPGFANALPDRLARAAPQGPEEEHAVLDKWLTDREPKPAKEPVSGPAKGSSQETGEEIAPGLRMRVTGTGRSRRCVLEGPALTEEMLAEIQTLLRAR
jgi:ParB/RepB/Spo0J family partition protein